jgi:hypothetical protein
MKKFLFKAVCFGIVATGIVLTLLMGYKGSVDYFYIKFTSPRQTSLIVGDSRSFQGLQPSVFDKKLDGLYDLPMYNYSFTIGQIAYGDALLASLKRKVDPKTRDGLFVLSVHPWVLAERKGEDIAHGKFFETGLPPHNMHLVDWDPNPEYFFRNYSFFHFKAIFKRAALVHDDGWLEEPILANDPKMLQMWLPTLREYGKTWKPSGYRLEKLSETIAFLKQHGRVVLVRMPNSAPIVGIESGFWDGFDTRMKAIASAQQVRYFSYAGDQSFKTYDGVHLDKFEGARFTASLCDSIKTDRR